MSVTTLPKFVVFYSTYRETYWKYLPDVSSLVVPHGTKASDPGSRFEIEQSKVHPALIHIRCSYNNKYLRSQESDCFQYFMVAAADEPEDDQTKLTSTLFLPEFTLNTTVSFLHVHLGLYLFDDHPYIKAGYDTSTDLKCQFRFVDWESLVTLPKHLTFRGDNGNYLGLILGETGAGLRFEIDEPKDKSIVHEVVSLSDGTIRIKNVSQGSYWKLGDSNGYILANGSTATLTQDSVFQPVKVNDDTIALRNMGNNLYCKRYTNTTVENGLYANESEIQDTAHLKLTELVASRRIEDIKFSLSQGNDWVYDITNNVILNPGQDVNNDSDTAQTFNVKISYKDTKTASTWTSINSSLKTGPVVTIQPDQIPHITDSSNIELTTPFQESFVWGETTTKNSHEFKVKQVTLEPMTTVTIKLMATVGTCHVPLTYTRYDVLDETTGQEETHMMDDGVYTGTNYFNFTFDQSKPKSITEKK
ncbi:hypothetical protein LINPERPRIM_LOCUS8282 [Linum perenne]